MSYNKVNPKSWHLGFLGGHQLKKTPCISKETNIRLADKCSSWPDQISVCLKDGNVSVSRSSFWPPVIRQHHHCWPNPLHLFHPLWHKAEVNGDAGERGSDVCATARSLAGWEDGEVQHNPWTWPQFLDTYSGQGLVSKSWTIFINSYLKCISVDIFFLFTSFPWRWNMCRAWRRLQLTFQDSRWQYLERNICVLKFTIHAGNLYGQCCH